MDARTHAERPFRDWLIHALACLSNGDAPADITWTAQGQRQTTLFDIKPKAPERPVYNPSHAFATRAAKVACHRDPQRWSVLYRILWRMQTQNETHLLNLAGDPDVRRFEILYRAVIQDIHHMKAFVRFQDVGVKEAEDVSLVAQYEPDHRILGWVVPFFCKRLGPINWAILTPTASVMHQNGNTRFGPGMHLSPSADRDQTAQLWRQYYRSTFNPERSNPALLDKNLPSRYRKHLTEAPVIDGLLKRNSQSPPH